MSDESNLGTAGRGTELELLARSVLGPADDGLRMIEAAIASMSETELSNLHERARAIEAMTRVVRDADRVAYTARRVQALCLRRLWEMGHRISPFWSTYQRFLAEMEPAVFAVALDDLEHSTIVALYMQNRQNDSHQKATAELADPELDDVDSAASYSTEEVRGAAAVILTEALGVGTPTTVHDAAARVVEQLNFLGGSGPGLPRVGTDYHGSAMQYAAEEIVREAIRNGDLDDLHLAGHIVPSLITCATVEGGWVRIPARRATIAQLRWMAEYRIRQGEQTLARGRALLQAAEACAALTDDEGTPLGDLLAFEVTL